MKNWIYNILLGIALYIMLMSVVFIITAVFTSVALILIKGYWIPFIALTLGTIASIILIFTVKALVDS